MSPSSKPMSQDTIMSLYRQGWTYSEIGREVGKTRCAVAGYIHRFRKHRRPPSVALPPLPDRSVIDRVLEQQEGNLSATARRLGVSRWRLIHAGYTGRKAQNVNRAKDPATRALVDEINASGMTDLQIADGVDMAVDNLYRWRYGIHKASDFLAQCVRTVIEKNSPGY